MTDRDTAAIAAARQRRVPTRLGAQARFIDKVLGWLIDERAAGRLTQGPPLTFVWYDFSLPSAAALGPAIDLHNGEASPGKIHLCAETLRPAHVLPVPNVLQTLAAHQLALTQRQLERLTSVAFDPASGIVQIRLDCEPTNAPIQFRLAGGVEPSWLSNSLGEVGMALNAFHAGLIPNDGLGRMLIGSRGPRSEMRIHYRDAMYIHLRFEIGLAHGGIFRVTAGDNDVRVTDTRDQQAAMITAVGTRSRKASVAEAVIGRLVAETSSKLAAGQGSAHISCIACPATQLPTVECGAPPVSVRHRHLRAGLS